MTTDLLPELRLDRDALRALREGARAVVTSPLVLRVTGPGALACLQGILSNDLAAPGDHALVYAALLTNKGMIQSDYLVLREGGGVVLVGPAEGRELTLERFRALLPPRLARAEDLTSGWRAAWLLGATAASLPAIAALAPGQVARAGEVLLARAAPTMPFVALATGPADALDPWLAGAGLPGGTEGDLEAARILAGWPRLGQEIDERTLPQEVRFDELHGVSYTKGCYVGQETVARLHFRGHANRHLRGLVWADDAPLAGDALLADDGKAVGRVSSTLVADGRRVGLGIVRREVAPGTAVAAGGRPATVVDLPHSLPA